MEQVSYSVVIPVYNSEKTIGEVVRRTEEVFKKLEGSYEILLVDDCSRDRSWEVLKNIHHDNPKIRIFHLIRNFGQHNAIICGFNHCTGKFVVTLDDDLQHPPEEIPKLVSGINEGFSVVYGRYPPENDNFVENYLSRIYQKLIKRILDIPDSLFISSFVIYRSETVKNIVRIKSSYPFLPAMTIKSAPINNISNVDVDHWKRQVGSSNYGLVRYIKYSLNLIINYSSWPLLFVAITGCLISVLSVCYGGWIIFQRLLDPGYGIMGWNSLMGAITFLGGAQLMSIGIIGEYLRRILAETSYGQQYVIGEMES
jgi:polyisoprenyl-phosphate glycosyltransferase